MRMRFFVTAAVWSVVAMGAGCHGDSESRMETGMDTGMDAGRLADLATSEERPSEDLRAAADLGAASGQTDLFSATDDGGAQSSADLGAMAEVDLAPLADVAPPPFDLAPDGCAALPATGTRVHVRSGATGTQTGSAVHPYASVKAALDAAELIGDDAVVLIAAGTYDVDYLVVEASLWIIGGLDASFTCVGEAPTILRAITPSQPALSVLQTNGTLLEHLTFVGNADFTSSGVSRGALYIQGGNAVLRDVHVMSQYDLTKKQQAAIGLEIYQSDVEVYDSEIVAGVAFYGGAAVKSCSSRLAFERVRVDNRNTYDSDGLLLDICNTVVPNQVRIEQSVVTSASTAGRAVAFISSSTSTLQLRNTAVVADAAAARALFVNGTNLPEAVRIVSSTLVGGKYVVESKLGTTVMLTLDNAILSGTTVFRAPTFAGIGLTLQGMSLMYSSSETLQSTPALPEDLTRDAAAFRAVYDPDFATSPSLRFEDPLLATSDGYHVTAASPARDATTCVADLVKDVDGDLRGATCDIGADEAP